MVQAAHQPTKLPGIVIALLGFFTYHITTCWYIIKQARYIDDQDTDDLLIGRRALTGAILYWVGLAPLITGIILDSVIDAPIEVGYAAIGGSLLWLLGVIISFTALLRIWTWIEMEQVEHGLRKEFPTTMFTILSWIPVVNLVTFPLALWVTQAQFNEVLRARRRTEGTRRSG